MAAGISPNATSREEVNRVAGVRPQESYRNGDTMNEAGHQQRALDVEHSIQDLRDPVAKPYICALATEGDWGASFHWIVVGAIRKHNWHTDSHPGLTKKLTSLGEATIAAHWATLERLRTSGWYTYQANPTQVAEAQTAWQAIRTWATI